MGVGALYAQGGFFPEPLLRGGGQEGGFRSGTLNVAGIVGFGAACRIAADEQEDDEDRAWTCRQALVQEGLAAAPGWLLIEAPRQSPFIACLAFEGVEGEALVVEMDAAGFAVGSGPACSAGEGRPSRTLAALGLPPEAIRGSVRVSLGRFSQPAESEALGRELARAASRLRDMRR
jgi:cysteine desulfurase